MRLSHLPWLLFGLSVRLWAGGTVTNATYESLSAALIGGGLVRFECDGTIALPAPIAITVSTVLDAQGHSITLSSGTTNATPLFVVAPTVPLGLHTLTLTGGKYPLGGAIVNSNGVVWASACTFRANTATGAVGTEGATGSDDEGIGGDGGDGGAGGAARGGVLYVYPSGEAYLTNCVFVGNGAVGGAGGSGGTGGSGTFQGGNGGRGGAAGGAWGGAVFNEGRLVVADCTFATNSVSGGDGGEGGLGGSGIWDSAIGDGASGGEGWGGAIYNLGTATVTGSTFHANAATGGEGSEGGTDEGGEGRGGGGGGAANGGGFCNAGTVSLVNCTFYANQATGGAAGAGGAGGWIGGDGGSGGSAHGGGLYSSGRAGVTHCTFHADGLAAGPKGAGGGGISDGDAGRDGLMGGTATASAELPLVLRNCILAGITNLANATGTIQDARGNLSSDATPPFLSSSPADPHASLNGQDPKLGAFGSYGGRTQTISLRPGSPAIGLAEPEVGVPTDQRGVARPVEGPDAGAFERQPVLISGRVLAGGQPSFPVVVMLASATSTTTTTNAANGDFRFVDSPVGPYQVRLDPLVSAAYAPAQYNFYLTELSEGQTNLHFYARAATLSVASRTSTGVLLTGAGVPQVRYYVQAAPTLVNSGSPWLTLSTNTADAAGRFTFLDTNVSQFPRRYFRVVQP